MKTVATITMLFVMLTAFAQFPRKNPMLLKGHQVEVKVLSENVLKYDSGYEHFFSDPNRTKIYMDNGDRRTKPDALGGKVFTVVDVTSEELYPGSGPHYTLKLEGNGETIYYSYKKGNAVYVNPINFTLPEDYYCNYITENTDDSGNKSFIGEEQFLYRVYKVSLTDGYGYGIQLMTGKDSNETGKGVTILMDNGKKIVKPDAVVVMDDSRSTSRFNALFTLTDEEAHLLANNKVLSYTLYKHEQAVYNPEVLQGMFECLLTKE